MNFIEEIIGSLKLKPHPEGGFFRETYRSENYINEDSLASNYKGKRNYSTCIYFLLTSDIFSAFHRIQQDEIWHFYSGSPIRLHTISKTGTHSEYIIGNDFTKEEVENRSVNLLYFGTFYKMSFQDYDAGLKEMMEDSDFLYGSLSKDTYSQGMVLGRKYRLLRISYTIFLYGIVAAVLAFSTAVIFF